MWAYALAFGAIISLATAEMGHAIESALHGLGM